MSNKKDINYFHNLFEKFLTSKGFRYTSSRKQVYTTFFQTKGHIDGESFITLLHNKDYKVSRGTVYSTLKLLVDCGLLKKVMGNNNKVYYESIHDDHKDHDHFICLDCSAIVEVKDEQIERLREKIARENGFEIQRHNHNIFAHCKNQNCTKKSKALE